MIEQKDFKMLHAFSLTELTDYIVSRMDNMNIKEIVTSDQLKTLRMRSNIRYNPRK